MTINAVASSVGREETDRLYRATGGITNLTEVFDSFVNDSASYRARSCGVLNIAYGAHVDEQVDIFLPRGNSGRAPVHIFIHGGYWYQFGKSEWSFMAEAMVEAGAIVVVPRYSLCPRTTVEAIVDQMRRLLCWAWRKIGLYGGDRDRLFVSGHSAGGHLAVELLLTDWVGDYGLPRDVLKGVTAISGLFDLEPLPQSYVQEYVQLTWRDVERLSPMRHIRPVQTPLLLAVGEAEPAGFHQQLAMFSDAWREAGNVADHLSLPGCHHLGVLRELSRPDGLLANAAIAQMRRI